MSARDIQFLESEIAPIMRAAAVNDPSDMQWAIDIMTLSNARRSGNTDLFEAKRESCIEKVRELPMTLGVVRREEELVLRCADPTFWDESTEEDLDDVVDRLGPLMRHRDPAITPFRVLDLEDSVIVRTWLEIEGKPVPKSQYQEIVAQFISNLSAQSEAVRKVRDGEMVSSDEIDEIILLFEGCEHPISIEHLREAWGAKRVKLEDFLAHILRGEDLPDWDAKVRGEFQSFIEENTTFNARQIEMLDALCNYVIDNETVAKPDLVKAPFTNYDPNGFRGTFEVSQINEILSFTEALTA